MKSPRTSGWFIACVVCVCVFQRHCHLRHSVRRGVSDGGGGGPVPVCVHVHEERTRSAGRSFQRLLHQHCYPGLPRWVAVFDRKTPAPHRKQLLTFSNSFEAWLFSKKWHFYDIQVLF